MNQNLFGIEQKFHLMLPVFILILVSCVIVKSTRSTMIVVVVGYQPDHEVTCVRVRPSPKIIRCTPYCSFFVDASATGGDNYWDWLSKSIRMLSYVIWESHTSRLRV